jgi:ribosome-associated protein
MIFKPKRNTFFQMTHDTAKDPTIDPYVQAALGKKALGLVVLDVGKLTSIADYFIICSGRSNRQVTAIAEHIQATLKKAGIQALSVEGVKGGHWVLMDYGHVIIHIFYDSIRNFYDLEGLWADARRIQTPAMIQHAEGTSTTPEARTPSSDQDPAAEEMEAQNGI